MESNNNNNPEENTQHDLPNDLNKITDDQTEFENSSVDPGFATSDEDHRLTGKEDKRSGNIDSNKSVSEMREEFEKKQDDATNLNNDREHGSYNPKNI
jgi:hypothetical protein